MRQHLRVRLAQAAKKTAAAVAIADTCGTLQAQESAPATLAFAIREPQVIEAATSEEGRAVPLTPAFSLAKLTSIAIVESPRLRCAAAEIEQAQGSDPGRRVSEPAVRKRQLACPGAATSRIAADARPSRATCPDHQVPPLYLNVANADGPSVDQASLTNISQVLSSIHARL